MKSAVAVIPARAGSKAIKNKNRVEFFGQPLFLWSVASALESNLVRSICITSDDEEIISWGKWASTKNPKICVVKRPDELSTDESPTEPCLFHACDNLNVMMHEYVILLQPTSPFRHHNLIDSVIEKANESGSCFTGFNLGCINWAFSYNAMCPLYNPESRPRRQDIMTNAEIISEDGNVYCSLYSEMKKTGTRFGIRPNCFFTDKIQSLQIDETFDLDMMKSLGETKEVSAWMKSVVNLLPK